MRVLVVEDDTSIGEALRRGLARDGHVVDVQTNGRGGLFAANEVPYDVVILDIMLPELNGYDVLKGIRARDNWVPILMLSSKDGEYDQEDALDLGADDYLVKPFSMVVVTAHLRALARRVPTERPASLSLGDLVVDVSGHRVTQGGTELHLTAREFALLRYLVSNPHTALSRHVILENVWESFYDGDPNIVEVYVGYLRRKLSASPNSPQIETLRGVGYRMVAGSAGG
ncbi:MAG: response regulator transcription factor [Propionibacteriaceae bacterium]